MLRFLDFAVKGHEMPAPGNARGSEYGSKNSLALNGHNNNVD